MKASREAKRIMNAYRKSAARRRGKWRKRNGSVGWIDDPWLEMLVTNSKRRYVRSRAATQKGEDDGRA